MFLITAMDPSTTSFYSTVGFGVFIWIIFAVGRARKNKYFAACRDAEQERYDALAPRLETERQWIEILSQKLRTDPTLRDEAASLKFHQEEVQEIEAIREYYALRLDRLFRQRYEIAWDQDETRTFGFRSTD